MNIESVAGAVGTFLGTTIGAIITAVLVTWKRESNRRKVEYAKADQPTEIVQSNDEIVSRMRVIELESELRLVKWERAQLLDQLRMAAADRDQRASALVYERERVGELQERIRYLEKQLARINTDRPQRKDSI